VLHFLFIDVVEMYLLYACWFLHYLITLFAKTGRAIFLLSHGIEANMRLLSIIILAKAINLGKKFSTRVTYDGREKSGHHRNTAEHVMLSMRKDILKFT